MTAKSFEDVLKADVSQKGTESEAQNNDFSIYKTDEDKRLVFGWASIALTVDGQQLEDRQKDIIDPEDLEEAAYEYVLNFRDTGEEHIPTMRKKGKLVESCVLTAEKQKAMGIPEGILPVGWWIGFKIEDDDAWNRVKSGHYRMFSIEGKANRLPVEKANPYHDERGRFTSANGGGGLKIQYNEIERIAIEDNNKAATYMMNNNVPFDEVWASVQDGTATEKAKAIIDKKYEELQKRYDAAPEGQKRLMEMSPQEAGEFTKASREKEIHKSLNDASTTQHVVDELGLHQKPEVVERETFDKIAADSPSGKMYRGVVDNANAGVTAKEIAEMTVTGERTFIGDGIHSDGIYFTTKQATATHYAGNGAGAVVEACISHKARIVDIDELSIERARDPHGYDIRDIGVYALYKGYNVIKAHANSDEDYYIALDRTALVFPNDYTISKAKKDVDGTELGKTYNAFIFNANAVAKTFSDILKFNPFHDELGRFASADGFATFTIQTKDPKKQHMADMAIARMKDKEAQTATATPPKPTKNYDKLGFADYDDADYHQLYNGRQYYQQQQLTATQKQAVDNYLEADTEGYTNYSHSQNMNYMMATGQKLTGKYQQTHDGLMDAMHNIGYNVELTRYDHADMVNGVLKTLGAGTDYEKMSQASLKKALVGQTIGENKFLSTSYNNFKNAPAQTTQTFDSRAVKINYKVKADVQGMMPGIGGGGDFGELILAPTNGTTNRAGKITDVRLTGQKVRRKGTMIYDQPRIEIDIEI